MRDESKIVLATTKKEAEYDDVCKETWKLKEIIAPVLKYSIKEYEDCSISDVIRFINAESISDKVPVDDLPAFIEGSETEMSSITERRIYYDIHFLAKNPKLSTKKMLIKLHIDFEVQKTYKPSNPSYPMTKRAVYYAARELSSQLKVITPETDYSKLEKVYSIWICNEDVPVSLRNSITRYYLERQDVKGICDELTEFHDLMEVIMVRRGMDSEKNTLFEYLQAVFSRDMDIINKYIDVQSNSEVKEALKTMCGLGESLVNEGREQGIQQGIQALVETLKEVGQTDEVIINKLMEKFDLSKEEAITYI